MGAHAICMFSLCFPEVTIQNLCFLVVFTIFDTVYVQSLDSKLNQHVGRELKYDYSYHVLQPSPAPGAASLAKKEWNAPSQIVYPYRGMHPLAEGDILIFLHIQARTSLSFCAYHAVKKR